MILRSVSPFLKITITQEIGQGPVVVAIDGPNQDVARYDDLADAVAHALVVCDPTYDDRSPRGRVEQARAVLESDRRARQRRLSFRTLPDPG